MQDRGMDALPRGAFRGCMRGGPSRRGRPAPRGCPQRGITFADRSHSSPEPMETGAASSQGVSFPPSSSGPVARRRTTNPPIPPLVTPCPVALRNCPYHSRPQPPADSSYVAYSPGKACPLCPDFVPPNVRSLVSHWLITHSMGVPLVQCTHCTFVCVRDLAKDRFRTHWKRDHPEEQLTNEGARNIISTEVSVNTRGIRLEPMLRSSADTHTATMLGCSAFKAECQPTTPRSAGAARQARGCGGRCSLGMYSLPYIPLNTAVGV
eukprot:GHVR01078713.1.p1 GENE.GHVR01078713.1~~GHVR01078713.1.p1  ORF type:complete len:265 (+),score=15.53 GHVR01078713.1:279-1073(+)